MKHAPAFNKEISLLEINGTMTILRTEKTKGKPIGLVRERGLEGVRRIFWRNTPS